MRICRLLAGPVMRARRLYRESARQPGSSAGRHGPCRAHCWRSGQPVARSSAGGFVRGSARTPACQCRPRKAVTLPRPAEAPGEFEALADPLRFGGSGHDAPAGAVARRRIWRSRALLGIDQTARLGVGSRGSHRQGIRHPSVARLGEPHVARQLLDGLARAGRPSSSLARSGRIGGVRDQCLRVADELHLVPGVAGVD